MGHFFFRRKPFAMFFGDVQQGGVALTLSSGDSSAERLRFIDNVMCVCAVALRETKYKKENKPVLARPPRLQQTETEKERKKRGNRGPLLNEKGKRKAVRYRIGQLYMISKHSHEQSDRGEGVEVVQNEPFEDPAHGQGQFTEKRVYLNSKLPSWARAVVPKIFYVTEKAWNYYPYTITEYTCSFLPKFSIHIETKYEDNKGSNDNIFDSEAKDVEREVCFVDIAYDEIPERYYKESEDLRYFKSEKTSRGLLQEGWRDTQEPIMCSYKLVTVKFEVWGLQTRVEQFVHKVVRDVLLLGHRQAFAWVDEWIDMTMDEVREFERATQEATNKKIGIFPPVISISETPLPSCARTGPSSAPSTPLSTEAPEFLSVPKDRPRKKSAPETLTLPDPARKESSGFRLPTLYPWHSSTNQNE